MPYIGSQQSPIRIESEEAIKVSAQFGELTFGYTGELPGIYKGDNFVFDHPEITSGKTVSVGSATWVLRKIHIHKPAEHLIDEKPAAEFECHLLHSGEDDPFARKAKLVIGVFFRTHTSSTPTKQMRHRPTLYALEQFKHINQTEDGIPTADGIKKPCDIEHPCAIDPRDFLPDYKQSDKNQKYRWFLYQGSLTSEPYTEDVTWYVMQSEALVLPGKLQEVAKCAEQNARPAYPLDRRFVLKNF